MTRFAKVLLRVDEGNYCDGCLESAEMTSIEPWHNKAAARCIVRCDCDATFVALERPDTERVNTILFTNVLRRLLGFHDLRQVDNHY